MNNTTAFSAWNLVIGIVCIVLSSPGGANDQLEMEERLLACAGCHQQSLYAPSINGKPVEYLYQQLLNFREGRRLNGTMTKMLAVLSTDYLHEIADYYANIPVDDSRRQPSTSQQDSAQAAMGKNLVQAGSAGPACVACHGNDLRGDGVAIPSLRGLSAKYIAAQLGAWQANTRLARAPDCMKKVADYLTGEEVGAVSQWIADSFEQAAAPLPVSNELPLPCGALQ